MTSLDHVYYFPIDADGNEIGEPLTVGLKPDGTADLSALPQSSRETLESFGAPDELRKNRLFPKDGARFLEGLLRMTNGYVRFRSTSEKTV